MKILITCVLFLYSLVSFAEPALVIKLDEPSCNGPVPSDQNEGGVLGIFVGEIQIVGQDAGGDVFPGSGKLTCKGEHVFLMQSAASVRGLPCFIEDASGTIFITEDTVAVGTPSGRAVFSCHFTKTGTIVIPPS